MDRVKPIKVLLTKIGMDGHDAGIKAVAAALRDEGMEVIYTGPWQRIETVVETALQEDVDVIGISSLASDHVLVPKLMRRLEEKRGLGITVIVGGIIPREDITILKTAGVAEVFTPGASLSAIGSFIKKKVWGEESNG